MDQGFKYTEENAMCTEDSYPYLAKNGQCKTSGCTEGIPKGGVTGFKDVEPDDEQALMEAVSKGPVSIAIEADHQAFQFYKGGVLKKACGTQLDHGVLLVGKAGECGLLSQPSYPVVKNGPVPPSPTPPSPTPPCQSDEAQASVQGLDGPLCTPKCDAQGSCPS